MYIAAVAGQLRKIRGRLSPYWQRKVLVEAAAEVYPPSSSCGGLLHVAAKLPNQVRNMWGSS
jgi:hypothetical protein